MKKYSLWQVLLFCGVCVVLLIGLEVAVWKQGYHHQILDSLHRIGLAPKGPSVAQLSDLARKSYEEVVAVRDTVLTRPQQNALQHFYYRLGVWDQSWWLGVKTQKNPCDMWMLQQIICETRPDYIIEAGTYFGGSALYFAQVLEGLGLEQSKVITIDIEDYCRETAARPLWKKRVEFIRGGSTDPAIVARIADRVKGKRVLVDLDSDHKRDHVFREMSAYGPLVNAGSYMVVEDTNVDGIPVAPDYGPGPMAAVRDFLQTDLGKTFTQDASREAMVLTFFPGGWLKKK
jgi:cephalosporin hydroxylase